MSGDVRYQRFVWNLFRTKINVRHKWPGSSGLWGQRIIILLSLLDWGGIMSAQAGPSGHLGFSLLDFLPEVITASHRGIFPPTRFEYDEVIYHAISAIAQSLTAWQLWTKQSCGSSGYEFSHSDIRELKDICATSVWLINYLNGVDGQRWTVRGWLTAQLWWMKSLSDTWLRRGARIRGD